METISWPGRSVSIAKDVLIRSSNFFDALFKRPGPYELKLRVPPYIWEVLFHMLHTTALPCDPDAIAKETVQRLPTKCHKIWLMCMKSTIEILRPKNTSLGRVLQCIAEEPYVILYEDLKSIREAVVIFDIRPDLSAYDSLEFNETSSKTLEEDMALELPKLYNSTEVTYVNRSLQQFTENTISDEPRDVARENSLKSTLQAWPLMEARELHKSLEQLEKLRTCFSGSQRSRDIRRLIYDSNLALIQVFTPGDAAFLLNHSKPNAYCELLSLYRLRCPEARPLITSRPCWPNLAAYQRFCPARISSNEREKFVFQVALIEGNGNKIYGIDGGYVFRKSKRMSEHMPDFDACRIEDGTIFSGIHRSVIGSIKMTATGLFSVTNNNMFGSGQPSVYRASEGKPLLTKVELDGEITSGWIPFSSEFLVSGTSGECTRRQMEVYARTTFKDDVWRKLGYLNRSAKGGYLLSKVYGSKLFLYGMGDEHSSYEEYALPHLDLVCESQRKGRLTRLLVAPERLILMDSHGTIELIDPDNADRPIIKKSQHAKCTSAVITNTLLFTASNSEIIVWDLETGNEIQRISVQDNIPVSEWSVTRLYFDGAHVFFSFSDDKYHVYRVGQVQCASLRCEP